MTARVHQTTIPELLTRTGSLATLLHQLRALAAAQDRMSGVHTSHALKTISLIPP